MNRKVLVVCTANVCRSPMGEALLRRVARDKSLGVTVASAGVRVPGLPVDPEAVRTMEGYDLDISGHEPRQLTRAMVATEGADLVLAMTRDHLRDIVSIDRSAWPRTFTMPEIVRRARSVRPSAQTETWEGWLAAVAEGRTARDLMTDDPSDDIEDPYGMSLAAHVRAAELLMSLIGELTELAPFPGAISWAPPPPRPVVAPELAPFAPPTPDAP